MTEQWLSFCLRSARFVRPSRPAFSERPRRATTPATNTLCTPVFLSSCLLAGGLRCIRLLARADRGAPLGLGFSCSCSSLRRKPCAARPFLDRPPHPDRLRLAPATSTEAHVGQGAVFAGPNVRANRRAAAGRLGPVGENVPRTADRAKTACRSASGLSEGLGSDAVCGPGASAMEAHGRA